MTTVKNIRRRPMAASCCRMAAALTSCRLLSDRRPLLAEAYNKKFIIRSLESDENTAEYHNPYSLAPHDGSPDSGHDGPKNSPPGPRLGQTPDLPLHLTYDPYEQRSGLKQITTSNPDPQDSTNESN